jgi:hypothetical protein
MWHKIPAVGNVLLYQLERDPALIPISRPLARKLIGDASLPAPSIESAEPM